MNYRQRILRTLKGLPVDHVPWAPRWELYFDAAKIRGRLPDRYRGWHIFDVTRDFGMGIKHHYKYPWHEIVHDVEIVKKAKGYEMQTEYRTPLGTVTQIESKTPELASQGVAGLITKRLVSHPEDYDPVLFILENTEIVPDFEQLDSTIQQIGEDGVALVHTGHCPASWAMLEYLGHEHFYFEMYDHPELLHRFLEALAVIRDRTVQLVCESSAEVVSLDGNYDMQMTPPPILKHYFLPYLREAINRLHAAGKLVSTHCDGNNDKILDLIAGAGFDLVEALAAPPMVHMTIPEAGQIIGDNTAIWGGLPTVLFSESTARQDFESRASDLLSYARTRGRLVMGTGDNVPTDGDLERVRWVACLVREQGMDSITDLVLS